MSTEQGSSTASNALPEWREGDTQNATLVRHWYPQFGQSITDTPQPPAQTDGEG